MEDADKKQVSEQRVRPTVIRRRAKEVAPPSPPAQTPVPVQVEGAVKPPVPPPVAEAKPAGTPQPAVAPSALSPAAQEAFREKEEKIRKAARKKKSKAELELEDIQRAGGLKQFAQQAVGTEWEGPSVERVFEPPLTQGRRKRVVRREFKKTAVTESSAAKKIIRVEKAITVSELSQAMGIKSGEIIKKLMALGVIATANQAVDVDTAALVAGEYGYEVVHTAFKEEEVFKAHGEPDAGKLRTRAPVVTVMGHVDHGKTSILDTIRKTKVTEKEAGGITQHIGAYEVVLPKGIITFIDTPGHEAFTRMRARGAQATDIVVLVVAAEDGIMPQTIEAIAHAKAAGVPIIVAINKIDKPQADAEKVKRGLTEHGLVPEEWGGDVVCVPTSAKTGQGIDHLLEMILLTAEVRELKGDFEGPGKGIIVESRLERGRGPVATVLVRKGILKTGDFVVCGLAFGRVRALIQSDGASVAQAHPSKPVEILGLNDVPEAGEDLLVVENERDAKRVVQSRQIKERSDKSLRVTRLSLEELQKQIAKGESHELPLVVKTDVAGSAEALVESLKRLSNDQVQVKVLLSATGGITESDVILAQASRAVILGFNVTAEAKARKLAEQEGLEIRIHTIIYELLDDIRNAMEGLLKPKVTEKFLGRATVQQVFKISKLGAVAGCLVGEGVIRRSAKIRLSRDGTIVYEGKISSLKRFKDDAREVANGMECGLGLENFNDIKEGDEIEAFVLEETAQKLLPPT